MFRPESRRRPSADDVVLVDGAFSAVPRNLTVTRPSSPAPTMDFSLISRPTSMVVTDGEEHSIDYFAYANEKSYSLFPSPSNRSRFDRISPCRSTKGLLPRLWDALSSPGKKGKAKSNYNYAVTTFDYSDLLPLDGEEGELIDEACYIDSLAVTGIDILSRLPPEIALYLLLFLDLPSTLACLSVSRTWRTLAADNGVWKELFYQKAGWAIDLDRAWARGWDGVRFVTAPSAAPGASLFNAGGWISRSPSTSTEGSGRGRRRVTALLSAPQAISASPSFASGSTGTSVTLAGTAGCLAPLSLDWRALYRARLELEKRWVGGEPRVTRISGHTDSVYCLEFDSSRIITGSRDRSIKVWSLRTGKLLATFRGHAGSVLCLKFDKDWDVKPDAEDRDGAKRGFMVSGSSDCSVCVWDLWSATGKAGGKKGGEAAEVRAEVRAVLRGHTGGVLDLRIDGEWIVSCSKDALIRVWNRETLSLHTTFRGHEGPVNAVGLQRGKVVSASGDGKMMLWDILSGERLRTFEGHDRGLACIEFKASIDDMIVSGSNDCKIKVWRASTGECVRTLVGHDLLVRALSVDPASGRLVSASYDRTVKVWDLGTGRMVREFRNSHVSHIFDVKFDVGRIVSTSHDQKIVVLDFGQDMDTALFV
ncbi:WD40 repeat-like protein [Heliocybe sulcata]|uniref:WD40 repeat-like protein n=1 Tax=Heliocybe sulcata TaxID=5364 RepID=A0A5C3N734_9AGAM|nr:WD40 repeat-like protein [Heliocybe sulcata]